jgi:hypothetical protein
MCCCQLVLAWEPLLLSTQFAIFFEAQNVGGVCIAVVPVSAGLLLKDCAITVLKSLSWCALPVLAMLVRASLA